MSDDHDAGLLEDALQEYSDEAIQAHREDVERCLEEGMDSSAVVVLNAGFESIISSALYDALEERDDVLAQRRLEDIEADRAWYSGMLEDANGLDIIDDDIHEQLDELRQERNEYVHADGLDDIAIVRDAIDEDDRADLDDAHNLYQDIIDGQERSVDAELARDREKHRWTGKPRWGRPHRLPA